LKEQLYNWRTDVRLARVVGKSDEKGEWMRPHGDWLRQRQRADAGDDRARDRQRIARLELHPRHKEKIENRVAFINAKEAALAKPKISLQRIPYFCPVARTTRRPRCLKAAARPRASAAT
jgi:indolepyruvate ferredoxin oxidoreductase